MTLNQDTTEIINRLLKRDWSFPNESGGNGLFGLHPYPAKFIPQIPRALIQDIGVAKGGVVIDPFCGSGTTLIEAQILGYPSIGIDLNPIACLISKVATTHRPTDLHTSVARCIQFAKTIRDPHVPEIPNLDHWFQKPIQKAIAAILVAIESELCEHTRDILRLALSSVIVRVSNQDSDTRYAAVEKNISASDVFKLFEKACSRYISTLPPTDAELPEASIYCRDVLEISNNELDRPVGLVVCSPPYPNAYEYWLYHKYRMWWLGNNPLYVKDHEIGARPHYFKKNHQTPEDFRDQMAKVFSLLKEICIDKSYACFVLGASKIHGKIIDNTGLLCDAAAASKFEAVAILNRDIDLSRKAFNLTNSRLKTENLVVFQKRRSRSKMALKSSTLHWHAYRYLPYEKKFAYREIAALPDLQGVTLAPDYVSVTMPSKATEKLKYLVYFSDYVVSDGTRGSTLQAKLENSAATNGTMKRQSTRYGVHGLHEYKGKFNPQIVRGILNAYQVKLNEKILDPFCGSGTTLVESVMAGHQAIGWDMNPFAVYLTNAKLAALNSDPKKLRKQARQILVAFDKGYSPNYLSPPDRMEYLQRWFPEENLEAIESFRGIIMRNAGELAPFFLIILSDLLRDYSLQEPSDLRIRRRKSPMPKIALREKVEIDFNKKIEMLQAGFNAHGPLIASAKAIILDSRNWQGAADSGIKESSYDFALSSPPYAAALPYIDTQRLSLIWLELLDPTDVRHTEEALIGSREIRKSDIDSMVCSLSENNAGLPDDTIEYCRLLLLHVSESDGFRRKAVPALLFRYFADMLKSFVTVRKAIRRGGVYALVVGTNRTTLGGKKFYIDTPRFLSQVAERAGWSLLELLPLETYKRYGLHAANAVQDETLIVLKHE